MGIAEELLWDMQTMVNHKQVWRTVERSSSIRKGEVGRGCIEGKFIGGQ